MQAKGRLQCWNADGQELGVPEGCAGKGQAATLEQQRLTARGLGGSCREEAVQQLEGCKGFEAGTLTAASLVEAAARDVQEKGRLQTWNGLVAAAARKQCSSWRWKLPRGSWRVLRVLRVLSV